MGKEKLLRLTRQGAVKGAGLGHSGRGESFHLEGLALLLPLCRTWVGGIGAMSVSPLLSPLAGLSSVTARVEETTRGGG